MFTSEDNLALINILLYMFMDMEYFKNLIT